MNLEQMQQRLEVWKDPTTLSLPEVGPLIHIIIGPNGKCMCGIYEDKAWSCSQILNVLSEDIQKANIIAHQILTNNAEPL